MREALTGLTVRGRAFLAAGVTAVVCAILLGQPALTRVGVLVLALPLATAFVLGRSRYRLALVRSVSPRTVAAGQAAQVSLVVTNEGRAPSGVLLMEDQLPYLLGTRPRFVVDGARPGWRRHISYQVRSDVRGRFEVGPMTVRIGDPFGLVELGRAFRTTAPLVVTPRTVPLPAVPLDGGYTGSGENRPRSFATGSAEDVTVREYRQGDDLRRVHWRSSARVGELMVRREEQPWQSRATVVLDNRLIAHRGEGVASSLETAVTAAASVAAHLIRRGYSVRLVTASGMDASTLVDRRESGPDAGPVMEALAVVASDHRAALDASWLVDRARDSLTVAILGGVLPPDVATLRRIVHHSATALAIALDVEAWSTGARRPEREPAGDDTGRRTLATLAHAGWRAVSLGPDDRLGNVWEELGRAGHRQAAGHGATGASSSDAPPQGVAS